MNVRTRLGLFAAAVLVAFAGAFGVGRAVGPLDPGDPPPHDVQPDVQPGVEHDVEHGVEPGDVPR